MKWSSPKAFRNEIIGKGYDMDGSYGAQCWDGADLFWEKQVGRRLMTKPGGNGVARQCWEVSRKYNAGTEFSLITDRNKILYGDWMVYGGNPAGHIAMSVSKNLGGYTRILGQNQGGAPYPGGGSKFNEINFSLNNFLGAFRFKYKEESMAIVRDRAIRLLRVYLHGEPTKDQVNALVGKDEDKWLDGALLSPLFKAQTAKINAPAPEPTKDSVVKYVQDHLS